MSWRTASRTALRPVASVAGSVASRSASPCGMRPSTNASRSSRRTCSVIDARSTLERRHVLASATVSSGGLSTTIRMWLIAGQGRRSDSRRCTVDTQIRPLVVLSTMVGSEVTYRSPLRSDANAGRVALVTGGGTGIGRATALELAGSGASVVVCGRREEPLERTHADVEAAGGACLATAADLREPDEVARVVDAALERFGRVD